METVLKEVCQKQTEKIDERLKRDGARLGELEAMQKDFLRLSGQLTEMLKNHEKLLMRHEERLICLEKRPSVWLDRILAAAIASAVTALVGMLI